MAHPRPGPRAGAGAPRCSVTYGSLPRSRSTGIKRVERLNYKRGDLFRLGKHGHVTAGHGQGFRTHSLCGADFLFGRDGPVVGSDDEPAGLGVPGGFLDGSGEDGALCRPLGSKYEASFLGSEVLRETFVNALRGEQKIAVFDWLNVGEKG